MKERACWITINRQCNLNCKWCYAKEYLMTNEIMPYELFCNLLKIVINMGIKDVLLIGGEPTLHPDFYRILQLVNSLKMNCTVVTNGLKLSDPAFCKTIMKLRLNNLHWGISLKGASEKHYIDTCGKNAFSQIISALSNCEEYGFHYSISYVITNDEEDIRDLIQLYEKKVLQKPISFSFCNDIVLSNGVVNQNQKEHPLSLNKIFERYYSQIDENLNGLFTLHQSFPLCFCDRQVLDLMKSRNQILTGCQVLRRNGIIFDVDGSLLVCNSLPGFCFGKYNEDFRDANTLDKFLDSERTTSIYEKMTAMPSLKCLNCSIQEYCGGGCCIKWFSVDYDSYEKEAIKWRLKNY